MKFLIIISVITVFYTRLCTAAEDISFHTHIDDYPPYIINQKQKQGLELNGIMNDVLSVIASKHGHRILSDSVPRARLEQLIFKGKLDATPIAIEWVDNPENFIFTDPIVQIRDVIFSLAEQPFKYDGVNSLIDKKIGMNRGYKYPYIDKLFGSKKVNRHDSHTEESLLKMLSYNRVDLVIMDYNTGKWLIRNNPKWKNMFDTTTHSFGSYDYRIMFTKKWEPFVKIFNKELKSMKKNGVFNDIMTKYQ